MSRQGWEKSDFPIICEVCLGDNPYMRMQKENHGKECKVCTRPFTVFRWCPGIGMRFKKTEICQTCAKIKNVCQTCVLDLEYGLPTQVRDSILEENDVAPRSGVNREYFVRNMEQKLGESESLLDYTGKANSAARELLRQMARKEPYYKRNLPHICSFFVKGECNRGADCPYRHEMPVKNELSEQNIQDRYYGQNDPVAKKILDKERTFNTKPPADETITTLYITGVENETTESDLRSHFNQYGEIKSVTVLYKLKCAFVVYALRTCAELAVAKALDDDFIQQRKLRVQWGKAKVNGPKSDKAKAVPKPKSDAFLDMSIPPPPGAGKMFYPSMDPTKLGSTSKRN